MHLRSNFLILAIALPPLLVGCGDNESEPGGVVEPGPVSMVVLPESEAVAADGAPMFTSLAAEATGIRFTHRLDLSHPLKRLYHGGFATGGIAIGDLDADALPDILLTSGPGQNQLYKNLGGMKFEPVGTPILAGGERWGTGVAFADVDNDGDLDIYACNYQSPNQLFINEGEPEVHRARRGVRAGCVRRELDALVLRL